MDFSASRPLLSPAAPSIPAIQRDLSSTVGQLQRLDSIPLAETPITFSSSFRAAALNDYFSQASQRDSLFRQEEDQTHHNRSGSARDVHFDPLETYLELRDELLSGPNPLAELNPAAVGGLVFEAHQAQHSSPHAVNMLRNDIAPHIDGVARAAGLMVWLRLDLEAIASTEQRPEAYASALALWNDYALLCQKDPRIVRSMSASLDPLLVRRLWKGFYLAEGSEGKRELDQTSLKHLWDLSELSSSREAFEQEDVSVISIFGLLAEASGEQPGSAFQHISRYFTQDMLDAQFLSHKQLQASGLPPQTAAPPDPSHRRLLTEAERHLITFFRSLVLVCTSREQYSGALAALLALLQNLALWDRLDQNKARHQRILPDQQPLVSHLMLRAIASEQSHMVDRVASMLLRLAKVPNAFNLASNRQLLHAYLDLTLSSAGATASPSVARQKQLNKILDILECLVPDFTDEAQLIAIIAVLPPRLVVRLLNTCRQSASHTPEEPDEDRLRCHALFTNLSTALTHLITESTTSRSFEPWSKAHQRVVLQVLCGPCLEDSPIAPLAIRLYQQLHQNEPQGSAFKISATELLQLVRYTTRFPHLVQDPYKLGHQLVSDFLGAREPEEVSNDEHLDHVDLSALASACLRLGFYTAASNCYVRMLDSKIIPSWQDVNTLLGQLSRQEVETAKAALVALKTAGFEPQPSTYVSLVAPHQDPDLAQWAINESRKGPLPLHEASGEALEESSAWIDMSAGSFNLSPTLTNRVHRIARSRSPRPTLLHRVIQDVLASHEVEFAVTLHHVAARTSLLTPEITRGTARMVFKFGSNHSDVHEKMDQLLHDLQPYPRLKAKVGIATVEDLIKLASTKHFKRGRRRARARP